MRVARRRRRDLRFSLVFLQPPQPFVASQTHPAYGKFSYTQITMPSARDRLAELRALRASGKKRIDTYEVEEQGDIYDEVDDDGYKKVIRSRLDEDDFVVDDNGAGYADDGREVWNERTVEYDSDDSDELPAQSKAAKRKREEEKQRKEKINNGISKYFNSGNAAASAPKPKVSQSQVFNATSPESLLTWPNSPWLLLRTMPSWLICSAKLTRMSYPATSLHEIS